MGNKKRQGPTLGARFTEPGVRFIRVSIRKERSRLHWLGSFEISHTTRGIFFQKQKRFLCCIYTALFKYIKNATSTWSVNFLLFSSLNLLMDKR